MRQIVAPLIVAPLWMQWAIQLFALHNPKCGSAPTLFSYQPNVTASDFPGAMQCRRTEGVSQWTVWKSQVSMLPAQISAHTSVRTPVQRSQRVLSMEVRLPPRLLAQVSRISSAFKIAGRPARLFSAESVLPKGSSPISLAASQMTI